MTLSKAHQPSTLEMSYRCDFFFFLENVASKSTKHQGRTSLKCKACETIYYSYKTHTWAHGLVLMAQTQLFIRKQPLN